MDDSVVCVCVCVCVCGHVLGDEVTCDQHTRDLQHQGSGRGEEASYERRAPKDGGEKERERERERQRDIQRERERERERQRQRERDRDRDR